MIVKNSSLTKLTKCLGPTIDGLKEQPAPFDSHGALFHVKSEAGPTASLRRDRGSVRRIRVGLIWWSTGKSHERIEGIQSTLARLRRRWR
jgi:hypothetical protein